jgi:hypothetical protein
MDGPPGTVEDAVRTLVADMEGDSPRALAELAIAQARMTDAGNVHASTALRVTLERLDEMTGAAPPGVGEWFSLLDIRFAIEKEGISPRSKLGRAFLARGWFELVTRHVPPTFPPGWRGTGVDGDPTEYAERCGLDYSTPTGPLQFWPARRCPHCGRDPQSVPAPSNEAEQ